MGGLKEYIRQKSRFITEFADKGGKTDDKTRAAVVLKGMKGKYSFKER